LGDDDPFVSYAAADALVRLGGKPDGPVVDAPLRLAGTKDHLARAKAVEVLGEMKATAAIPAMKSVASEGDDGERLSAVHALGRMEDPAAVTFLQTFVTEGRGDAVSRLAAARALGRHPGALSSMRRLIDESDGRVRQAALIELTRRDDKEAIDKLRADLENKNVGTRHGAAWALYQVGDKRGLLTLAQDRLKYTDYAAHSSAGDYLTYIDHVVGDKRSVAKALIDVLVKYVDEVEAQNKGDDPMTFEDVFQITRQLQSCTGKDFFDWGAFKSGKEARAKFKQNWLDWWTENGPRLPEVNPRKAE
jgi:HEAT repeat protein